MSRRYYSSRKGTQSITLNDLYYKLQNQYLLYKDKDYFRCKAGISGKYLPDSIKYEAAILLGFPAFPITKWETQYVTEDHLFDAIEFLYDKASKPGNWTRMTNDSGFEYDGYDSYDDEAGKKEYREMVNTYLCDYGIGYELSYDGIILSIGKDGLRNIFVADIVPYDEPNVDGKVRAAILKWRSRHSTIDDKKEAIRDMADVFEWLKINRDLSKVLSRKDESAIFDIANNFGIRHHNPNQKTNYDKIIWYSWMFHFYLATYHAVIRLLIKNAKDTA